MGKRNVLRLIETAWEKGERFDMLSTDSLKLRPWVDDTGKMQIGDGTYDMDFQIFVGSATESFLFDVGNSKLTATAPIESNSAINTTGTMSVSGAITANGVTLTGTGFVGGKAKVTVATNAATLTGTSYDTVVKLTCTAATTVTFPDAAAANLGAKLTILSGTDAAHVLKPTTADKLIVPGDVAADSITLNSTSSNAGVAIQFMSDGANWFLLGVSTQDKTDYTVQT